MCIPFAIGSIAATKCTTNGVTVEGQQTPKKTGVLHKLSIHMCFSLTPQKFQLNSRAISAVGDSDGAKYMLSGVFCNVEAQWGHPWGVHFPT